MPPPKADAFPRQVQAAARTLGSEKHIRKGDGFPASDRASSKRKLMIVLTAVFFEKALALFVVFLGEN